MPAGRPAKYKTCFHPQDCIRMGKEGLFKKHMANHWKISIDTITRWRKAYPEFQAAYQLASIYRLYNAANGLENAANELDKLVQGSH